MKSAWRSWFYNIVGAFCLAVIAAISTGVALTEKNTVAAVGFGVAGAAFWAGAFRVPMMGVVAKPRGVVVREFWRTTTVAWDKIDRIEIGSGASAVAVTTAPVILRRRSNGAEATLVLNALGGYGLFRPNSSPGRRAVTGLNEHLRIWRSKQDPVGAEDLS